VKFFQKTTKQEVRKCADKAVDIEPAENATELIAAQVATDVKLGTGNEGDKAKRDECSKKIRKFLNLQRAARVQDTAEKASDAASERRMAEGDDKEKKDGDSKDAKSGDKEKDGAKKERKAKPKKAGDRRKKGMPFNIDRIICARKCNTTGGTCETPGSKKMKCVCKGDDKFFGKWCDISKENRDKMNTFCDEFTKEQAKAHCKTGDWDADTKAGMLKLYGQGCKLCRFNKEKLVANLKQAVATLDAVMDSDTPLDMGRVKGKISDLSRTIGDNNWNQEDKYDIQTNFQKIQSFVTAEKNEVETTETDDLQTNNTTEDGGELLSKADSCGENCGLSLEAGSDQTSTAEANIDVSELGNSD